LSDHGNDRGSQGWVKYLCVIKHPLKYIETSPIACAPSKFTHSTSIRMTLKVPVGPDATPPTLPLAEILVLLSTGKSGQFRWPPFFRKGIISFLDRAVAVAALIARSVPLAIEARKGRDFRLWSDVLGSSVDSGIHGQANAE
jgi:hypothetical protein